MELSRLKFVVYACVVGVILLMGGLTGCMSRGIPYRVGRLWFDTDWQHQVPAVTVAGSGSSGWHRFIVTAGVVVGHGVEVRVSDVRVQGELLYVQLDYTEPERQDRTLRRVARLEVEILEDDLPPGLKGIRLAVGANAIDIQVGRDEALGIIRGALTQSALGISKDTLEQLRPENVFLLRSEATGEAEWHWHIELAIPAGDGPRVRGVVDATTGRVVELVVD